MTDRELMQMALYALEQYVGVVISVNDPNDWTPKVADAGRPARIAIEALRARLAQPEPEPEPLIDGWPLYSGLPPRRWQGLTDEEAEAIWTAPHTTPRQVTCAIEAKLKEKNDG